MKVAVVTPVRNAGGLLADTMRSVLAQVDAGVELDYRIQDGASTDDTVHVAEQIVAEFGATGRVTGRRVTLASAPDTGMYDALATAFGDMDADWYCYLNAGDLWDPRCLTILRAVDSQSPTDWLCGLQTYYAADGTLVHTRLAPRFTRRLLRAAAYGRGLPTVQQESTFWSARLQAQADLDALRGYRLAGDAYLWWSFAAVSEPAIIQAVLGGFRYHGGHLGVDRGSYLAEVAQFAGPLSAGARARIPWERALWEQPARIKARRNPRLYLHSTSTGGWVARNGQIAPGVQPDP